MNKVYKYIGCLAFVLTLVGYPAVSAVSSFSGLENRPLAIGFRGLVLALAIGAVFLNFGKHQNNQNRTFWIAWLTFWVSFVVCVLADNSLGATARISLEERLLFCLGITMVPALSVCFIDFESSRDSEKFISNASIWIGSLSLFANLVYITRFGGIRPLEGFNFRAESQSLNSISIGHLAVTILLFCFWRITQTKSVKEVPYIIVPIAVACYGVLVSSSRGPVLSLAAAVAVLTMAKPKLVLRFSYMGLLLGAGYAVYYLSKREDEFYLVSRVSNGFFEDDTRRDLLSNALTLIWENPIFGSGLEPLQSYPHNLVVESFLVFGLFTGIPFVVLLWISLRQTWVVAKYSDNGGWAALLYVQYFVGAMFSGNLSESAAFFSTMVLILTVNRQTSTVPGFYRVPALPPASPSSQYS